MRAANHNLFNASGGKCADRINRTRFRTPLFCPSNDMKNFHRLRHSLAFDLTLDWAPVTGAAIESGYRHILGREPIKPDRENDRDVFDTIQLFQAGNRQERALASNRNREAYPDYQQDRSCH